LGNINGYFDTSRTITLSRDSNHCNEEATLTGPIVSNAAFSKEPYSW